MADGSLLQSPVQLRLQLDGFEGPLELLLSLIEQHRLPITQVSLAQVADQYLAQVRALPVMNPDLLAEFLGIGSKLLLLKSRALLLSEEPDPAVEETVSDLEQRLAEYQVVRAAAEYLQRLELRDLRTYVTGREPVTPTGPPPLAPMKPEALVTAWRRLLRQAAEPAAAPPLMARVSVEERRASILDVLGRFERVSFTEVAGDTVDEVVATFLAVLELYRRGRLTVVQEHTFGDLLLVPVANESR